MTRIRKWLVVILIVWGACSVCLTVWTFFRRQSEATVFWFSSFSVCQGPDPVTGLPQEPRETWPPTAEKLYVCGYLETDGKVNLNYLLIYEEEPVGWFLLNRRNQTGYVFEQIPPTIRRFPIFLGIGTDDHTPPQRRPGHYRVEVWKGRRMLVFTEFYIVDETNP